MCDKRKIIKDRKIMDGTAENNWASGVSPVYAEGVEWISEYKL